MKKILLIFCLFAVIFACLGCGLSDKEEREAAIQAKKAAKISMEFLEFPMYCQTEFTRRDLNDIGKVFNYNAIEIRQNEAKLAADALDALPRNLKYLESWTAFRNEARYLMGKNMNFLDDFKKILEENKKGKKIDSNVSDFNKKIEKYKEQYQKLQMLYAEVENTVVK